MSRFKNIDPKLEKLSIKLEAELSKDRPEYPESLRTFEERRIDWEHTGIFKAVIIQPTFESQGVNQKLWNFINVAWIYSPRKIKWSQVLVYQKEFMVIESMIDSLLEESEKRLSKITINDLK